MGRGVNYLDNAKNVTYFDVSGMGEDSYYKYECNCGNEWHQDNYIGVDFETCSECELSVEKKEETIYIEDNALLDWYDFKVEIIDALKSRYKSLDTPYRDRWDNGETQVILENNLCEIGLSEYGGIASLSIAVSSNLLKSDYSGDYSLIPLAQNWIDKVWNNVLKVLDENIGYDRIDRVGGFSNGESFYSKV